MPDLNLNKTVSGMNQYISNPPSAAELNAAAEVPESEGSSRSIGATISADDARTGNDIRLSKNMKLRIAHKGVNEIEQTWTDEPTYATVDGQKQYVAASARPSLAIADDEDGLVFTDAGSFTESSGYVDGSQTETYRSFLYTEASQLSSSSQNDGLVGGSYGALSADNAHALIDDMPGRTGGPVITSENAWAMPGRDITTSETVIAIRESALTAIQAMATGSDASALTATQLRNAGVIGVVDSETTSNLGDYKTAIAAESSIADLDALQEIIDDVNAS